MSSGSDLESLDLLGRRLAALYPAAPAPHRACPWLPRFGALAAAAVAAALVLAVDSGTGESRNEVAAGTLLTITDLLELPISTQLEAALYRAAALLPGPSTTA